MARFKIDTAYVDLDGVYGDFYTHSAAVHGVEVSRESWPPGVSLQRLLKLPFGPRGSEEHRAFWGPILERPSFFMDMPPFPWAVELTRFLLDVFGPSHVVLVTGPASGEPSETADKLRWIRRHLWEITTETIILKQKWRLSKPGVILIDDWERQVDEFRQPPRIGQQPGLSFLFPQPWNENHFHSDDPLGSLRQFLGALECI